MREIPAIRDIPNRGDVTFERDIVKFNPAAAGRASMRRSACCEIKMFFYTSTACCEVVDQKADEYRKGGYNGISCCNQGKKKHS